MKVSELIKQLKSMPQDLEVIYYVDGGYYWQNTYYVNTCYINKDNDANDDICDKEDLDEMIKFHKGCATYKKVACITMK